MEKYHVTCYQTIKTSTVIEAHSEKEAEEIADAMIFDNEIIFEPQFPECKYEVELIRK